MKKIFLDLEKMLEYYCLEHPVGRIISIIVFAAGMYAIMLLVSILGNLLNP